ncbi:MAG: hypothetical protein WCJ64_20480, partial [Rhodospirillaceae bacterium]
VKLLLSPRQSRGITYFIKSRELHLQKLGHFLKKKDRVIAGGLRLEAMKNRDSVNEYRVIRVSH